MLKNDEKMRQASDDARRETHDAATVEQTGERAFSQHAPHDARLDPPEDDAFTEDEDFEDEETDDDEQPRRQRAEGLSRVFDALPASSRLWSSLTVVCLVVAALLVLTGRAEAAFVVATLGVVAWFIEKRGELQEKAAQSRALDRRTED